MYSHCQSCRRDGVPQQAPAPTDKYSSSSSSSTRRRWVSAPLPYLLAFLSFLIILAVALTTFPFLLIGEFQFEDYSFVAACRRGVFPCSLLVQGPVGSSTLSSGSWAGELARAGFTVNATVAFWSLFVFRYFRLAVNTVSYLLYRPSPVPRAPTLTPRDVTVLIPSVDVSDTLVECVRSVCANSPAHVLVITVGRELRDDTDFALQPVRADFPAVDVQVHHTAVANKRRQIDAVIPLIRTRLTSMADASVFWGPRFLASALAPLEDPRVWLVGTNKRVRRARGAGLLASFWNFIGCLYLERHNFEIRGQNAISGEVFVISGRTNVIRTDVIRDPAFRAAYVDERFFLGGIFGPLAADDDNFIVRWCLKRGAAIKFQYDDDARIEIAPIGEFPRFLSQCLRWSRTTWRSNPAALKIPHVWLHQPYSVYSVYLASFVNFALPCDILLVYVFCQTSYVSSADWLRSVAPLAAWILCSKMVKLVTYFWREPRDLIFFPGYVAFAYLHSFIKLWALLTFWDVAWSGRNIVVDAPLAR